MPAKHVLILLIVIVLVLFGISLAIGVRSDRESRSPEEWIAAIQNRLPLDQTLPLDDIRSRCLDGDRFILPRNLSGGCEAVILPSKKRVRKASFTLIEGTRVEVAFEPAEESLALPSQVTLRRHDVRVISVPNPNEIPREGAGLIVVAQLGEKVHFRVFDHAGGMAVDQSEGALPKRAQEINDLKKELARLGPERTLTRGEQNSLAAAVSSILDYSALPTVTLTFLSEGGKLSFQRPPGPAADIAIHFE